MRAWLTSLTRDRALELGVAVALGYALVLLVGELAKIPLAALAQHVSPDLEGGGYFDTSIYYLDFRIGSTVIVYGPALSSALTLVLVVLLAWTIAKRRDRQLGLCPFCASRIPYDSTHCAFCGSGVAPGEP